MAKSKDGIKYATSQARLNEDEAVRVAYNKHGTPLEAGKIADSEPVDLFSSARNIPKAHQNHGPIDTDTNYSNQWPSQYQTQRDLTKREGGPESGADSAKVPNKTLPALSTE